MTRTPIRTLTWAAAALACALAVPARAEHVVRALAWSDLAAHGELRGGQRDGEALVVSSSQAVARAWPVAALRGADVGLHYAIRGRVSARGVEGRGYLELWSHHGARGAYYSRTLGEVGPMAALTGDVDERAFLLPFDADGSTPPEALELNVALPGRGTVRLRGVELVRYDSSAELWGAVSGATSPGVGIAGAALGTWLGLLGALSGWAAARSRWRSPVLGAWAATAALGAAAAVYGLAAARALAGPGLLAALVASVAFLTLRGRYRSAELRRMRALDGAA